MEAHKDADIDLTTDGVVALGCIPINVSVYVATPAIYISVSHVTLCRDYIVAHSAPPIYPTDIY